MGRGIAKVGEWKSAKASKIAQRAKFCAKKVKNAKKYQIAPKAAEVSKTPKNSAKKFVQNCKGVKV